MISSFQPLSTLELSCHLLERPSISPDDQGCLALIQNYLAPLQFNSQYYPFESVNNLWLYHGQGQPLFVFAGHVDVVPTGDPQAWRFPPFKPTIADDKLYARGAADMKCSVAAFTNACARFVERHPQHKGCIAILLTSDEEDQAINGTRKVIEHFKQQGKTFDYCLVGEPSSQQLIGDTIKNGRRGSLNAKLSILGKQGHIAYPHKAKNPIHLAIPFLNELVNTQWDKGNNLFPPTALQLSNIHAGVGATNVIPDRCQIDFNFRFSPESSVASLQERVIKMLAKHTLDYQINWQISGEAFGTPKGELLTHLKQAIYQYTGLHAQTSTDGGTSDGRFIANICDEVVEFGPTNGTIHQIDEYIEVAQLDILTDIYEKTLSALMG